MPVNFRLDEEPGFKLLNRFSRFYPMSYEDVYQRKENDDVRISVKMLNCAPSEEVKKSWRIVSPSVPLCIYSRSRSKWMPFPPISPLTSRWIGVCGFGCQRKYAARDQKYRSKACGSDPILQDNT